MEAIAKRREVIFLPSNFNRYSYRIKQNYKYPFYHIISIYVSHSSLKFKKGSGSNSDSQFSNSLLLDSADRIGSLNQIRTNSSSESGKQFADFKSLNSISLSFTVN
jgi:hypothetical protein